MKVAIFGVTGKTGQPLLEQALAAGHQVTALVRDARKITVQNPNLTVIQGDATDAGAVSKTIQGADAVLNVLGHVKESPKDLLTVSAQHIISAMKAQGVKRIVALTGAGVRAPQDRPNMVGKFFTFLLKTLQPEMLEDSTRYATLVQNSGLEAVVVRGPRLTDGPRTPTYRVGWAGVGTGTQASYANVAAFMLTQLTDNTYLGQMPVVSN